MAEEGARGESGAIDCDDRLLFAERDARLSSRARARTASETARARARALRRPPKTAPSFSRPRALASLSSNIADFRELVGPADVELATTLRPGSLRARFGKSRVLNGLHCTDLPEDGDLECNYFFANLSAKLV